MRPKLPSDRIIRGTEKSDRAAMALFRGGGSLRRATTTNFAGHTIAALMVIQRGTGADDFKSLSSP
jgi:hypothetical protein